MHNKIKVKKEKKLKATSKQTNAKEKKMKNELKLKSLLRKDDYFRTLKLINVNVFAIHQLNPAVAAARSQRQSFWLREQ